MRKSEPFRLADWLSLAAAPTFGLMALLTAIADSGAHQVWCAPAVHGSALGGMVPMYALMSAFHLTPWVKRISGWGRAAGPG
jgi:hypothetical protein